MSAGMSAPTPYLSHLSSSDYERVYEPAEDTFLLMDALESDVDFLASISPTFCLEVGSGSGTVITFLANLIPSPKYLWMAGKIDVLLFNPPYVVTPSQEVGGTGIEASWAGGKDGREVIDRFLPSAGALLSPCGVLYLVLLEQNCPSDVCERLAGDGLTSELIISRRTGTEKLHVYKFSRT